MLQPRLSEGVVDEVCNLFKSVSEVVSSHLDDFWILLLITRKNELFSMGEYANFIIFYVFYVFLFDLFVYKPKNKRENHSANDVLTKYKIESFKFS